VTSPDQPDRLSVVAHELRNAVAALSALAERAERRDLPVETVRRLASLAVASGRDVERLLSDADLLSLHVQRVALSDLVGPLLGRNVDGNVDESTLVADETRLRQAVANLVANGLRYGTEVTIEARAVGDEIVIDVRDDGPGVDAGIDIFREGVSGSGSTGYGLWLARAIAEAHGGSLQLVDDPGGEAFRLAVPRSPAVRG
jgi:signal transduction histidine kinase